MNKIIVSILVTGLLISTSMVSVNAFETVKLTEQPGELPGQSEPIKVIPYANVYVDDNNTEGPWDGSYEHPYQKIQQGVNVASDGDKVFVFNGIYEEDVTIKKTLKLIGESRENTIIEAEGTGVTIRDSNGGVTISGFTITMHPNSSSASNGIYIKESNDNIIKDNIIKEIAGPRTGASGVLLYLCCNNTIVGNTIENISSIWFVKNSVGIDIRYSWSNVVTGNLLKNNDNGISLWDEYNLCKDNMVSENVITGSIYGIDYSASYSSNVTNTFYNNDISNNYFGIYLLMWTGNNMIISNNIHNNNDGIHLHGSCYNTISANTISKNNIGIRLNNAEEQGGDTVYVKYNTITENNITDNKLYGVFVPETDNNIFYYNNFVDNGGIITRNAEDRGSNTWDDGNGMGNYWDDYLGWDLDHDGIGDIPYRIPPSSAGNKDNYPLMNLYGSSQSTPSNN
jgi:nitrous oxidase accessory protein